MFNSITYILYVNDTECWLVDCGDVEQILKKEWIVKGVLLTHSHFDHIYGLEKLLAAFPNVMLYTNVMGLAGLENPKLNMSRFYDDIEDVSIVQKDNIVIVNEGESVRLFDGINAEVIETPGHDQSCLSFIVGNYLFTGDSYIPGIKVVTNFPKSNDSDAICSLNRLKEFEQKGLVVCPGHDIVGIRNLQK